MKKGERERVVSIGIIISRFVRFCTMEYFKNVLKLSASDVIVSQKRFQWRQKATFLWVGLYFW